MNWCLLQCQNNTQCHFFAFNEGTMDCDLYPNNDAEYTADAGFKTYMLKRGECRSTQRPEPHSNTQHTVAHHVTHQSTRHQRHNATTPYRMAPNLGFCCCPSQTILR